MSRRTFGRLQGRISRRRREYVLAKQPLCAGLGCWMPSAEVDHRIPLHRGGLDTLSNLQGLCKSCHSEKTSRERKAWTARPRKKRKPGISSEWQALIDSITPTRGNHV